MAFWRSRLGMTAIALAFALAAALGGVGVQVWRVCHPPRTGGDVALAIELARIDDVRFDAADGVDLAGWLFHGEAGHPAIVVGHDHGGSKADLVNVAIELQRRGFTVVAFDFRGHGDSARVASTLGVREKRDVLGAVDFVAGLPGVDARRIGVYGSGMGALAAALAAGDRPGMKVLVLDAVVPDAGWLLAHRVYDGWGFGVRHLGFVPEAIFRTLGRIPSGRERAAAVLPALNGRDILLLAPASDARLASEVEALFRSLPERRGSEANLVTLPRAGRDDADGASIAAHDARVAEFFATRLVSPAPPSSPR